MICWCFLMLFDDLLMFFNAFLMEPTHLSFFSIRFSDHAPPFFCSVFKTYNRTILRAKKRRSWEKGARILPEKTAVWAAGAAIARPRLSSVRPSSSIVPRIGRSKPHPFRFARGPFSPMGFFLGLPVWNRNKRRGPESTDRRSSN